MTTIAASDYHSLAIAYEHASDPRKGACGKQPQGGGIMMKRLFIAAIAAATLATGITAVAGATPDRLLATPANVCRSIVEVRSDLYSSYGECMGRLNKDAAAFRGPAAGPGSPLISIEERCIQLEAGVFVPPLGQVVQVTYPFHFVEPEGWPFPEYWAQNRNQCENTLYAYHAFTGEV